jgi:hypothetical protein
MTIGSDLNFLATGARNGLRGFRSLFEQRSTLSANNDNRKALSGRGRGLNRAR